MRIHSFLPLLLDCLRSWERRPSLSQFETCYYAPMEELVYEAIGDVEEMYALLDDLEWDVYRRGVLKLDPEREEKRVLGHLKAVEKTFGFGLRGEIILFGAFGALDGYARFDRGTHRVFLGLDDSPPGRFDGHDDGDAYLDILEVHELTHVARESRRETWEGWGLDLGMTHDEFSENQPVLEHLFGEGFSCAVSELLVPTKEPWHYVYQGCEADLQKILENGAAADRAIHREIRAGADGDWGRLYSPHYYRPSLPVFSHYVWAWYWVKNLLQKEAAGDPAVLLRRCSRDFMDDALGFQLQGIHQG